MGGGGGGEEGGEERERESERRYQYTFSSHSGTVHTWVLHELGQILPVSV